MDLERAEHEEGTSLAEAATPSVVWSWDGQDERNLPVEPEAAGAAADPARALQELRAFHLYGRRPSDAATPAVGAELPALLHRYRDLTRVRHEYPICVNGSDAAAAVRSLTEWTDQWVSQHAQPGDAGEQLRHNAHRLEAAVRLLLEEKEAERFAVLWDRATATLLETSQLAAEKEKLLRDHASAARKTVSAEAELVSCGPHAAQRLLRTSASVFWRERCTPWIEELDALVRGLQNIITVDFAHSDEARSPGHLRASLGAEGEDVDAGALSELLAGALPESALPHERRERIQTVLTALTRMQPVFDPRAAGAAGQPPPVRFDEVFDDCAAALREQRSRMACAAEFFRAVRIARLEIQNQYRPDIHDPYFAGFDERYLTADEVALCPPVLVRLTDEQLSHAEIGLLLAILNGGSPIKILLELRDLYDVPGSDALARIHLNGAARLASMATALHQVYVLQAPVSRASALRTRLLDGLRYPGPALFCVYAPAASGGAVRSAYLRAAAAAESRFFPVLAFDPARGDTLADRVDIGDNTANERTWPGEAMPYRKAEGGEASMELAFTPADFLFCDHRLAAHFWILPADRRHDSLTPVHEYLEMTAEQAAGRIPYLTVVDRDGRLGRAVVTRAVVEVAWQCRAFWRGVQESGGIDNSFARRLLAAERERLGREKEREIEAIERNYLAQLDQDVGELTREIVQRIASQLMGTEGVAFTVKPSAPAPPPGAAPAAGPAAAAATVEEEEEAVSFDDPYIDTPLCTSCNECTQLNNRLFAYNGNKQAEIKDATAGPFSDLVRAAELCPVHIIHPGKPKNPAEPNLAEWVARAERFN
jgi:ferredoxin